MWATTSCDLGHLSHYMETLPSVICFVIPDTMPMYDLGGQSRFLEELERNNDFPTLLPFIINGQRTCKAG